MSNRLDQDRENELQPKRKRYCKMQLELMGYEIEFENGTQLKFRYKDEIVTLFPYSGWFSGKTVQDGRGIKKLLSQIGENAPMMYKGWMIKLIDQKYGAHNLHTGCKLNPLYDKWEQLKSVIDECK